ncbi:MAG: glycoside hydrolase family 3 protein [Lachnospiraceae bacterium]|nr:glycoside hydrolase family 3 protein [Lachnospiraceae bacterium]
MLLTVLLVVYQSGFLSGNGARPGGQSQAEEAGTAKKAGLGEEPGADGEEGTGSGQGIGNGTGSGQNAGNGAGGDAQSAGNEGFGSGQGIGAGQDAEAGQGTGTGGTGSGQGIGNGTGSGQALSAEELQEKVQAKLSSMSLEEKVAQLFLITPEALTGAGTVTQAGEATKAALEQYPVGGLIYFQGNIVSEQQVTDMIAKQQQFSQERIGLPLLISVDEEGGQVTRVASCANVDVPKFEDTAQIGASGDSSRAHASGQAIGSYLSRMGFNLDFAPVADTLTNPDNTVVKRRSYGSDPQTVAEMAAQNLKGLESQGVYGCIKHFPGHGATLGDTHNGYAYTDKSWEDLKASDLIPFQRCVAEGVSFVMVGHISLPQAIGDDVPASCSQTAIQGYLRGELGYQGIVLTDALNMGAIVDQYSSAQAAIKAFQAGSDMLLMPADFRSAYQGVLDAVNQGSISQERLNESVTRILKIKMQI